MCYPCPRTGVTYVSGPYTGEARRGRDQSPGPLPTSPGGGGVATWLLIALAMLVVGCSFAPRERFVFHDVTLSRDADVEWFDIDADSKPDFSLGYTGEQADRVIYDDNQDGTIDRVYRFTDYRDDEVPHVVILLDSISYDVMRDRYVAGDFRWFGPPVKMISAFPSLTEVCYSEIFNTPPLPGVIDTQYDPRISKRRGDLWSRVGGDEQPWERRTHYHASYDEHGLSFLDPRAWYAAELQRAYDAIEASPDRVTYVYFASAASMVCKYGREGASEVLDGARKLCLRLLHERRGAVRISMMADHGHNFTPTKNVTLDQTLKDAGFRVADRITSDDDVVISINGLVTNASLHTRRPAGVAKALVRNEAIELAIYREGDRTIVRSRDGAAAIETHGERFRYVPIDADVLGYAGVKVDVDGEGFATEWAWLEATIDHEYPNGPPRIAAAMSRMVVSVPDVIVSVRDGYSTGKLEYEKWIDMKSTHGGLNQVNCATFVMSMTDRLKGPVLPREVLKVLEPSERPRVVR